MKKWDVFFETPYIDVETARILRHCLFGWPLQQYYGLCSLEIGHVRREDAGLYTVTATNPRGTISCSATLDVQSKYDTSIAIMYRVVGFL